MTAAEMIQARNARIRAILKTVKAPAKIDVDAAVKSLQDRNARVRAVLKSIR